MKTRIGYALLMFAFFLPFLQAQPVKTYIVKHTKDTPVIDGRLLEASWEKASATDTFHYVDSNNKPEVSTVVKALWDSCYLYIAFIVQDKNIWADKTAKDDQLWERDVVEIFIDTDGDSVNYVEIGIAPNTNYYDYLLPTRPSLLKGMVNWKWDIPGFKVGVSIAGTLNDTLRDSSWVAEIAIPFKAPAPSKLHRPVSNEVWRVNFCRVDTDFKNTSPPRYFAWNPTGEIAFHRPSKFGRLIFNTSSTK